MWASTRVAGLAARLTAHPSMHAQLLLLRLAGHPKLLTSYLSMDSSVRRDTVVITSSALKGKRP
jgi:hypothetical protein